MNITKLATAYLANANGVMTDHNLLMKKRALKTFTSFYGNKRSILNLKPLEVQEYMNKQRELRTPFAANDDRRLLSVIWDWGVKFLELPDKNPFRVVSPFPHDVCEKYIPPVEDVYRVMQECSEENSIFLLFMLHTGARMREVRRLTWSDVDLENGFVTLSTKKRADRSMHRAQVPLTRVLMDKLMYMKKESSYVFPGMNGKEKDARCSWLETACKRAGVKKFTPHSLRHLAATTLFHKGYGVQEIQALLRHTTPVTTARYIKRLGAENLRGPLESVWG